MAPNAVRELTKEIPEHLAAFIVEQEPSLYTPIDHASWRFILKVSRGFFAQHAHRKYLDGLSETGISIERIPLIAEMDACLRAFNWRAVAVSGFIPPAAFMEFFSLGVLPIACDMRSLEHLAYTPAPDIVHEAAGHAPIIADPEYAEYLRAYGEISRKAIYSHEDMDVYQAIRHLSEVKERPSAAASEIAQAQDRLDRAVSVVGEISEAAHLARMNWWTVEYGLVGEISNPKIYGAGLLSSLGESYHCLDFYVKKRPLSLDCIETPYDITRPQPQLFVARDFQHLQAVLEEFASTMAFRQGGATALAKAVRARTVTTIELDSGVQISGQIKSYREKNGAPSYLQFEGPTQIAYANRELPGQGPAHHREGFGTALGRLRKEHSSPSDLSEADLKSLTRLEYESGIVVEGKIKGSSRRDAKTLLISFSDCTVRDGDEILFRPEWGSYDLACGVEVASVYGGPADYTAYMRALGIAPPKLGKQKSNLTVENRGLNRLYAKVREFREQNPPGMAERLTEVFEELEAHAPWDWLLRFELLELSFRLGLAAPWASKVRARLAEISRGDPVRGELISRGLATLK